MASSAKLREEREWSEEANGQQGSAQGVCGVLSSGVVAVQDAPRRWRLGDAGGASGAVS
jgi:hypothetical protein